jgi:hypothetical protein
MFIPIVVVWIAAAGISLTVQNQPPHEYPTEYDCKLRVAEIVNQISQLQAQMPNVRMAIASATCPKR